MNLVWRNSHISSILTEQSQGVWQIKRIEQFSMGKQTMTIGQNLCQWDVPSVHIEYPTKQTPYPALFKDDPPRDHLKDPPSLRIKDLFCQRYESGPSVNSSLNRWYPTGDHHRLMTSRGTPYRAGNQHHTLTTGGNPLWHSVHSIQHSGFSVGRVVIAAQASTAVETNENRKGNGHFQNVHQN